MQKTNWKNILSFVCRSPRRLLELVRKVALRLSDSRSTMSPAELDAWLRANTSDFAAVARSVDPEIWEEAARFSEETQRRAAMVLAGKPDLGGGGIYPFLYFLARILKPGNIVETGVGAGFSSRAFLCALEKNGAGRLYSSDFPFFRLDDPEKYIGVLVEPELRGRWRLHTEGDRENLPKILKDAASIDLFHYDSDKSYSGRVYAESLVRPHLSSKCVLVFDDIQNNTHFTDLVRSRKTDDFRVFKFERKHVGVIGLSNLATAGELRGTARP